MRLAVPTSNRGARDVIEYAPPTIIDPLAVTVTATITNTVTVTVTVTITVIVTSRSTPHSRPGMVDFGRSHLHGDAAHTSDTVPAATL